MNLNEAIKIIEVLFKKKEQIEFDADGADDRFYLNDLEWQAIKELYDICLGEF